MTMIKEIPLLKIKTLPWVSANKGRLLLVTVAGEPGGPEAALRCDLKTASGPAEGVIILSGQNLGKFAQGDDLSPAAIDLTGLFEIVAISPAPAPFRGGAQFPGMLLQNGEDFLLCCGLLRGSGNYGYIRVADGENLERIRPDQAIIISQTVDVRSIKIRSILGDAVNP